MIGTWGCVGDESLSAGDLTDPAPGAAADSKPVEAKHAGGNDFILDYSDSGPFSSTPIPTLLLISGYGILLHGASDSLQCTDPVFFAAAAEVGLTLLLKADEALAD